VEKTVIQLTAVFEIKHVQCS